MTVLARGERHDWLTKNGLVLVNEITGERGASPVNVANELSKSLVDYEEKGYTVELLGMEDVEGTEAYKLQLTKENGKVSFLYLDTENFVIFRQEAKRSVEGNEFDITIDFSDFKPVGDIVLAHSMQMSGGPMTGQITFNDVELNVEVDDEFFAFPGKSADEAETDEASEG